MNRNGGMVAKFGGRTKIKPPPITFETDLEEIVYNLNKETCIYFLLPEFINQQLAGYRIYSPGPTLIFDKNGNFIHVEP